MRFIYLSIAVLFLAFSPITSQAEVATETIEENQRQALQKQIQELQAQLRQLNKNSSNNSSRTSVRTINIAKQTRASSTATTTDRLKLMYKLHKGANGEDVRVLQKILASDPTIYPEGLITGFFGQLTEQAVKRFQAKIKLEQVGAVGPQTLARINEILTNAGVIGDVPADLLNSRVKIKIEIKDGKEEVKIEIKCDSSGSGNTCSDDSDEDEDDDDSDDEKDENEDDSDDDEDEDDSDEDEDD